MALPPNADVIVTWGYWLDEATGLGVLVQGDPATITFDPVLIEPEASTRTPNVRDPAAKSWIKTRQRVATVDPATGYFAVLLVASNDPDLDAYGGREVVFQGEASFVVEVPYNAPEITVDAELAGATGLELGATVRGLPLIELALIVDPPPQPVYAYLTASQTLAALDAHDTDPAAHPDIRALIDLASDSTATTLLRHATAATDLSGHRVVTLDASGELVYADNTNSAHAHAPLWLTTGAATTGAATDVVASGDVTEPSWSWTPGPVYLGGNGLLTQAPPSAPGAAFLARVGYAADPTTVYVDPQPSIVLS